MKGALLTALAFLLAAQGCTRAVRESPAAVVRVSTGDPLLKAVAGAGARVRVVHTGGLLQEGKFVGWSGKPFLYTTDGNVVEVPVNTLLCVVVPDPPWKEPPPSGSPVTAERWAAATFLEGSLLGLMLWPVVYVALAVSDPEMSMGKAFWPSLITGWGFAGIRSALHGVISQRRYLSLHPRSRPLILVFSERGVKDSLCTVPGR